MKHTAYYVKYPDVDNRTSYRGPFPNIFDAYLDMKNLGDNIVIKRTTIEEEVDFEKEKLKLGVEYNNLQKKIDILNDDFGSLKKET